jgi:hypothetical protein
LDLLWRCPARRSPELPETDVKREQPAPRLFKQFVGLIWINAPSLARTIILGVEARLFPAIGGTDAQRYWHHPHRGFRKNRGEATDVRL